MAVTLKLDKSEYKLGETMRAEVTVTNDGKVAAEYPVPELALPSVSLHVVRRPDAPTPESHLVRIKGAGKTVKLEPGKSTSGVIEIPAVDPHGQLIEAYYAPRGDIHPHFQGTEKETSNRVPVRVHGHKLHALINTEAGDIRLEFFPERAMNHVLSFVQLAQKGYFDGIVFHRVVPRFVIQGGDPTGTGSGGPGYKLPAEFNEIQHVPGILSMARTSDPHSAGSQFFICTDDCPNLDEQYTVFGKVVDGMDAVMTIGESDRNAGKYHMRKVEIIAG